MYVCLHLAAVHYIFMSHAEKAERFLPRSPPHHPTVHSTLAAAICSTPRWPYITPACFWLLFAFPDAALLLVSPGDCGETIPRASQHWTRRRASLTGVGVGVERVVSSLNQYSGSTI